MNAVPLPPPCDFGLPPRFSSWRREQLDFVQRCVDTDRRFIAGVLPTGSGKSLVPLMVRALSGEGRLLILTASKQLQDQYTDSVVGFSSVGLFDVRGQQNYECLAVRPDGPLAHHRRRNAAIAVTVDRAPCHAGVWCRMKQSGCTYYDDVRAAAKAPMVVTNYKFWLSLGKLKRRTGIESLGAFDWIVCDEAHQSADEVCDALHLEVEHAKLRTLLGITPLSASASVDSWRTWARDASNLCTDAIGEYTGGMRDDDDGVFDSAAVAELRELKALGETLAELQQLDGEWVVGESKHRGLRTHFDPVWPAPYTEELLFRGAPHVMLMSATISPKTPEILGIGAHEIEWHEYASSFPVDRRPVYIVDLGEALRVRVDNRTKDDGYAYLVTLIDAVLARRLDRKTIIHSVSYRLTEKILKLSRYRAYMFTHQQSGGKADAVEAYRKAATPAILISPSVTTGEDFPGVDCEVIIIPKIPFVDRRDPVMKRRDEADAGYTGYLMMQTLVQSAGRGMRSAQDRCEVIILDDHARWAYPRYRKYAPKYFQKAVQWPKTLPAPLPKL